MVIQNVQDVLKKFQDTKNKEYKKTQKQINELIGTLIKHQIETENTINRVINELKKKIDNIKDEVTHDMKNLRKKSNRNTKHSEVHSRRLEQEENRISELEDKIEIEGKTEELLNNSRPVKRIYKNSLTPSKDQT
jgi:tRNA nucleotidyltransferase/poly(A) polymerase